MKGRISINGKRYEKYFKSKIERDLWLSEMIINNSDKPLAGEIWKPIPCFGLYEASNFGRIRSLNYKKSKIIKVLTPAISTDGYLKTMLLNDNGIYKSWTVHKFVALAFYGESSKEINHIDGNKTNNNIDNLEYCTRSENMVHAIKLGLQLPKIGELNGMSKLTNEQVLKIREAKINNGRYWGRNKLADELKISAKHLQKIANNKNNSWSNV